MRGMLRKGSRRMKEPFVSAVQRAEIISNAQMLDSDYDVWCVCMYSKARAKQSRPQTRTPNSPLFPVLRRCSIRTQGSLAPRSQRGPW